MMSKTLVVLYVIVKYNESLVVKAQYYYLLLPFVGVIATLTFIFSVKAIGHVVHYVST